MAATSELTKPTPGSKGESTRNAIVQRAAELSTVHGLEGLSIGRLAEELELSKSGLFAHFRSKEALQLAVVDRASERFAEVVVRPTLRAPRGEPRVAEAFRLWRTWPSASYPGGCFFIAAAAEFDDRPGVVRDAIARTIDAWLRTLATIVRGAITEGHFDPAVDPEQFVLELFGILLGFHQLEHLLARPDASVRSDVAFEALLARSRAPAPAPAPARPRRTSSRRA